jgi:integrase
MCQGSCFTLKVMESTNAHQQDRQPANPHFQGCQPGTPANSNLLGFEFTAGDLQVYAHAEGDLVLGGFEGEVGESLGRLRAARARGFVASHAALWNVWDAFADHHGFDPEFPSDVHVAAFVHARAAVGVAYQSLSSALGTIRLGVEGSSSLREAGTLTVAGQRHLSGLHYAGWFTPPAQAPLLTVGQIAGMVERAPSSLHAFLVGVTYLAGLRVSEWAPVHLEHVQADAKGLKMLLPSTKTGEWQKVAVKPMPGTPFDVVDLAQGWLKERGREPGPLVLSERGGPMTDAQLTTYLREAAAAVGIREFSTYSLRRSLAVHMDLLEIKGHLIRQRLRHAPESQTYRRYIEPLLALLDREGAKAHYLDGQVPVVEPIRVQDVKKNATSVTRFAFAALSMEELEGQLDMPKLRVPKGLVYVADSSLDRGRRQFELWVEWCHEHGYPPAEPPAPALTRWVVQRSREVDPVTVESQLSSLRIGYMDATGSEYPPGWDQAHVVARAGAKAARATRAPRYLSRPATAEDREGVCEAVMTPEPPADWAVACLAWATGATTGVEVLEVGDAAALVSADGYPVRVESGGSGLLDPVLAASTLAGVGPVPVAGAVREEAVHAAGLDHSKVLQARVAVVLLAGSGCRPSDIARARVEGLFEAPGGLAVKLRVVKGRRPSRVGRDRLIWAPHRAGAADPVAAWEAWSSWHPAAAAGPLLPADLLVAGIEPLTANQVGRMVAQAIKEAGVDDLTPYGFRYGRAQEMHEEGLSDETIAEALGHEDIATARGYIQAFDPFVLLEEEEPTWAQ